MRRILAVLVPVLAAALVAAGCTTLPDSGPVHVVQGAGAAADPTQYTFKPPGPRAGDSPEAIVRGFLLAQEANPLTTAVAREFLSDSARKTWKPNQSTVVYETRTVGPGANGVRVTLDQTHRLDQRGGWQPGPGTPTAVDVQLVQEGGEWRIVNPPNALVVPSSYFEDRFAPYELFFFDRTNRVLVPDTVYLPRGQQTATNLVRGLLAGPGPGLAPVVRSAVPAGTDLDLSVSITDGGLAEVPLSGQILALSPEARELVGTQLAWTLRQLPGVERIRLLVDGAPVPLPDGRVDTSIDAGQSFDPVGAGMDRHLLGIRGGAVAALAGTQRPGGPLARRGFVLRSVAASRGAGQIAAVSGSGRSLYVAPNEGSANPSRVRTPIATGTDLLRPGFDMFGDLWVIDRTSRGAVVHVVRGGRDQVVDVPGVSGRPLAAGVVSYDGTRLAVARTVDGQAQVTVINLVRNAAGEVARVGPALSLPGVQSGPAIDLGWAGPNTLAVLSRPRASASQVTFVQADGSPGDQAPQPVVLARPGTALVVSIDTRQTLYVQSGDGLYPLVSSDEWASAPSPKDVVAAAYPN